MNFLPKPIRYGLVVVVLASVLLVARAKQANQSQPSASRVQTTSQPSTSTANTIAGSYRDGTYTGPVTDAYYGNIQVKVTVAGGKIKDIAFLDYPSDKSRSRSINQNAMPILTKEAISAQSANVDIVSGATDTSHAFRESLGSALKQA